MPIITLTSDLGLKDYYVASVQGAILSQIPEVNIVDITHSIEAFNISQTAYVIRNCYKNFPTGSIHILGVDSELSLENSHLAVFAGGHYFIGTDNGTFSLLFDELKPDKIENLEIVKTYFGFGNEKAKDALEVLSDTQIEKIKAQFTEGGVESK